jgi:hypothetical protein
MYSNETTYHWIVPKVAVDCEQLKPIAIYCVVLFIVSLISNPTLIWILLRNRELMNPVNVLILALASLSIIGTLIELPLVSVSAILCK